MSDETKPPEGAPAEVDEAHTGKVNAGVEEAAVVNTPYPTQDQVDAIRTGEATVHDFDSDDDEASASTSRRGRNLSPSRGLSYKTR